MHRRCYFTMAVVAVCLLFNATTTFAEDDEESRDSTPLIIEKASWTDSRSLLYVKVKAEKRQTIRIENAFAADQVLTHETLREDELKLWLRNPLPVPCRIKVTNESTGRSIEKDVRDTETYDLPANCSPRDSSEPPTPNQAPTANAGNNQKLILAADQTSISVTLNGSASSDPDGTITEYLWSGSPDPADEISPTLSLGVGTYEFSLTVKDNEGAASTADTVVIDVAPAPVENKPPVAKAGDDQNHTLSANQTSISITLNGSASYDPDGTITRYTWSGTPDPSDEISPTVTLGAGSHQFILTVTDNNNASAADTVVINVAEAPIENQPPVANAGTDQSLTLDANQDSITVVLDAGASYDPDGSITQYLWDGSPNPDDVASPTVTLGVGTHLFTLIVKDDSGATSNQSNVQIIVYPFPSTAEEAHATISVYEGPATCIACHENEAVEMHGSVHYQQTGPAYNVTNIIPTLENPLGLAGERGNGEIGINTYCGSHENSPRFTCAGCHVGNGRFPKPNLPSSEPERSNELSNIDCLMCHQETYKRFPTGEFESLTLIRQGSDGKPDPNADPIILTGEKGIPVVDPVTKDFQFEPADAESKLSTPLMSISRHEAARTVHATTRKSCLNCHAGAGGGDGTKRGDLSSAMINPAPHIDIHMSNTGSNMTCSECHDAGGHRLRGRGLDLRPNDVPEFYSCESCHDQPHGDYSNTIGSSRDKHATRVACQTCHIPTYAKGMPTEIGRDWENPHFSPAACNGRGGWLPEEIKGNDLTPTYQWFDGTSQVYVLGQNLDNFPTTTLPDGSQAITLGLPNGWVDTANAKIFPMKEHTSKSAVHLASNSLIAHSTYDFFRTGNFDNAIQSALEQTGRSGDSYRIAEVHTYQTINHGVEASEAALACGACHASLSGGPVRMDLANDMGYELKADQATVCTQCHGREDSLSFTRVHEKHVTDKRYDCSNCHNFSRPERGLRMSR